MTESEAIETLIGIRRVSGYSKSREEALDMAIAALEKQEGKKPITVETNIYAADVRPVVRCKDCKHRPTKPDDYNPITTDGFALEFPDEKCPCQCGDGWYSKYPDDDWYCPIGERKGGDE